MPRCARAVLALALTLTGIGAGAALAQMPAKPQPADASAAGACSLLTREEVKKLSGGDQLFNMVPEEEQPLIGGGSSCTYAGVVIQLDPFSPAMLDAQRAKDAAAFEPVAEIGSSAYFRHNKTADQAELFATVGGRVLLVQVSIVAPATLDEVRPRVLALAKAAAARVTQER